MKEKLITPKHTGEDETYRRKNEEQIMKVRRLLRSYVNQPMEQNVHLDLENKLRIAPDVLCMEDIGINNLQKYIEAKCKGTDVNLKIIFATENEKEESKKVENKTVQEIVIMIFKVISEMTLQQQSLQQEVFIKNVKNKTKEKHINFYYGLIEMVNNNDYMQDIEE